ncbi:MULTISPECIES: hypothetical protein [unclassified Methylobacterium]|uniref:hypothetical protein n=1 Tax=unclassified Methylobacterium TaxID=2615210 RepID=UPI003144FF1F
MRLQACIGALALAPPLMAPASARIVGIDITAVEPFADGAAFGQAVPYERVIGTARGEIDPTDSANAGIADIALAPRNARGFVEYRTDLFILRPKDFARGSGTLLYEVLNRGRKFLFNWDDVHMSLWRGDRTFVRIALLLCREADAWGMSGPPLLATIG